MAATIPELIKYYADLLILQYRSQPKARENIKILTEKLWEDNIFDQVKFAFNLETAIGKQLDILGKYIGANRFCAEAPSGILDDEEYRTLLRFKVIKNSSDHSYDSITRNLFAFFGNQIVASTKQQMDITYIVDIDSLGLLAECALEKDLLPQPAGVGILVIKKTEDKIFGFQPSGRTVISERVTGFRLSGVPKVGETLTTDKVF